jgi:predicted Zn-ribbon and HTH transcriptional regulator
MLYKCRRCGYLAEDEKLTVVINTEWKEFRCPRCQNVLFKVPRMIKGFY